MDDHKLPLDLTIYGAIHQHEMRKHKASGSPFVPSMIWQGVYSIKFKKVSGPLPSADGRCWCLCIPRMPLSTEPSQRALMTLGRGAGLPLRP